MPTNPQVQCSDPQEAFICEILKDQISSSLQGSILLQEISKHRDHFEEMVKARNLELIEERALLRTMIDNMLDLVYVKDLESHFLLANEATQKLMGVSSEEELLGKTDFDYYPQELAMQYYADDCTVIGRGQSLIDHEEPMLN